MEDEELRFCFNIDVTEDEFYKNIKPEPVNIFDSDTGRVVERELYY